MTAVGVLIALLISTLWSAPCEWKDIGTAYGICRNGLRDIVYYWKNDCTPGGASGERLPAKLRNISCDKGCNFNEFFNVANQACQQCQNGTYPDESRIIYTNVNESVFQKDFLNVNNGTGGPWTLIDNVITSGKQGPNADLSLTLKEVTVVSATGNVSFSYQGFPNRGIALRFYIDNELKNTNDTNNPNLPLDTYWHWYSFPLTFGTHNLTWRYTSSNNTNASTIENIRIRFISVNGTGYLPLYCKPCPVGFFDDESTFSCQACPFNTYTNKTGSTFCTSCPTDQYALEGSSQCSPRITCNKDIDYVPHYHACQNGRQTVSYMKIEPSTCNSTTPANESASCQDCNPGQYRNISTSNECTDCPSGQYRGANTTDDSVCQRCPADTAAFRATYVKHLDFVAGPNNTGVANNNFSTQCESNVLGTDYCGTVPFWESHGSLIRTGHYSGPVRSTLVLSFTADTDAGANVEFEFTPHLASDSSFFYSGGFFQQPTVVSSTQNNVAQKAVVSIFSNGSTSLNFTWTFFKRGPGIYANGTRIPDYVDISYIALRGINRGTGGATECATCPNGTESPEGSDLCSSCARGTFSFNGSACTVCDGESITEMDRAFMCEPCGQGSVAVDNHTRCEVQQCGFTLNDTFSFDLTELSTEDHVMFNLSVPQTNTRHFYSICNYNTSDICRTTAEADGSTAGVNVLACELNLNRSTRTVIGNKTDLQYFENDTTGKYGVNVTYYTSYYRNGGGGGPGGGNTNSSSAEVLLMCTPGSGYGHMHVADVFQTNTSSRYHIIWETEYGCRLCSSSDYEKFTTECVKPGKHTVTHVLKQSAICAHGFVPPDPYDEKCKRAALNMSGGALFGIILAGLVVIALLVGLLVFLIRRNKALENQLVQKDHFSLGGAQGGQGASGMVSLRSAGGTAMFGDKQ